MSCKLESDVCCRLQIAPSGESYGGNRRPGESNGSLLPGLWHDSLHVTCGLTACTPGSAPGPTLGNEYGKKNVTFKKNFVSLYRLFIWPTCFSHLMLHVAMWPNNASKNWQRPCHLVLVDTSSAIVHVTEPARTRRPTKCDKIVCRQDGRTGAETLPGGKSRCEILFHMVTDVGLHPLVYCRNHLPDH